MSRNNTPLVQFVTLLISGIVVFFATGNAIAGALLPAARAGWKSFRTGVWLLNADGNRPRAKICSAFYMATALWQAAAASFGAVVLFIIVAECTGRQPNMDGFAATMITLTSGVILSTVLGLAASLAAAIHRVRVWIHPRLREMVLEDLNRTAELPPRTGFNFAIFVLATSLAFPIMALCCYWLIDPIADTLAPILLLVGFCVAIAAYIWLSSRIIAFHPAECWMPDDYFP